MTEQEQGRTQPVEDDRRDAQDDRYEALGEDATGDASVRSDSTPDDGAEVSADGSNDVGADGSDVGSDDGIADDGVEAVVLSGPASERLVQLGLVLPAVPAPLADYVPAVRTGDLVHTSGQLPFQDGVLLRTGVVGDEAVDVTPAEAALLARRCALNALAAVAAVVDLDSVVRVVKVTGFVASAPGFGGQPVVVDGASQLLGQVFGDAGAHARSAVGVVALPLGAPVEVEITVEVG